MRSGAGDSLTAVTCECAPAGQLPHYAIAAHPGRRRADHWRQALQAAACFMAVKGGGRRQQSQRAGCATLVLRPAAASQAAPHHC